jgi:hypothetical protein
MSRRDSRKLAGAPGRLPFDGTRAQIAINHGTIVKVIDARRPGGRLRVIDDQKKTPSPGAGGVSLGLGWSRFMRRSRAERSTGSPGNKGRNEPPGADVRADFGWDRGARVALLSTICKIEKSDHLGCLHLLNCY